MPKFGNWQPDPIGRNTEFSAEALNVLPKAGGWGPWQQLLSQTSGLPAAAKGGFIARDPLSGAVNIFAGTATGLYKYTSPTVWEDVSKGGGYTVAADDYWVMRQYGSRVIAVARGNNPQSYVLGTSTDFADLAGSPPQAALVEIVGDFVVLGDINDPSSGRSAMIWSALNDAEFWTIGQRFCDRQIFPDGDIVTGLTSLETGLVIQQNAVRAFQRVPTRSVFEFAKIESLQGTSSPYSLIQHKGAAYYRGFDGFIASQAGALSSETGVDYVDEWFAAEANMTRLHAIVGSLDPTRPRIFWAFPSQGNSTGINNRILGYDLQLQGWFHANIDTEFIFSGATGGTTIDTDTSILDDFPMLLTDSVAGLGGVPNLAAFDSSHEMNFFTGLPMEALLRTSIVQPLEQRFYVRGCTLIGDAAAAIGRVGVAENAQATIAWKPPQPVNARHGRIPAHASGRFLQYEIAIPQSAIWTDIQSVEPDVVEDGEQ